MSFNTFRMDPYEKWRREELEAREFRNAEYLARKDRETLNDDHTPEVIQPGDLDHVSQMTFDFSQGWEDRAYARLRRFRESGYLKPRQIIDHGDHLEPVYESEIDLEPFQNADACVRCRNFQPDNDMERSQLHRRLSDQTGYVIPEGLTIRDCCCYCGGRLDTQKVA